ncbi:hypothetical protein LEMA_P061670.1 [Plenodomus lingam JN3]|uniref:Uncharacterized protein n=1 Tax=Leptosphaeria maculans (strain JN3 / isolate v23.1.3 / race Av1-4-5-6-7-8) TaxID=985895 RepID=E4ZHZ0_LEPMJ|nr:hypothetical protein LEMA_P061670.1 [Plenodomus lingam JN3]CBX91133.1 hypothetical protein LEMA_P061670.1 [Plenodomus lingam JN3]
MDTHGTQSRKTNIIDDAVALEYSLAQQKGKSKGKGKAREADNAGRSALVPRAAGISKSKAPIKPKAVPAAGQQHHEGYGIRILLHKEGSKQRQHARASTTFRNKSIEAALDIVESYAGSMKRQQFINENKTKTFIGNWIEMAETLAFGASPTTKLTRADWAMSEFMHPDQRPHSESKKGLNQIPNDDSGLEEAINNIYASLPKKRKHAAEETSDQNEHAKRDAKQQKYEHVANLQAARRRPTNEAQTGKSNMATNGTVHREMQNQKLAEGQKPVLSTQGSAGLTSPTIAKSRPPAPDLSKSSRPMGKIGGKKGHKTPEEDQEDLKTFLQEIGLDSSNAETATTALLGPSKDEHLVITVTQGARGHLTLHSTTVTRRNFDSRPNNKRIPRPYLKDGRHGPGGQFDNDPDRATGQGHDCEPEDARNFETYMGLKWKASRRHPNGESVFPQAIQDFRALEPWYREYVKQYPGKRLDQWPCGCLKVIEEEGDESEEE